MSNTPNSDLPDDKSMMVQMDDRRQMVCLEAAWEIDAVARILPGLVPIGDEDSHQAHLVVRAMAGRLLRLTHVLMGALSDNVEETERLENVVGLESGQG